jgi:hypothetical protein
LWVLLYNLENTPQKGCAMKNDDDLEMTPEEARQDHWDMLWFLARNAGFGASLGLFIAAGLMFFDIGGLGTRIEQSQNPLLPMLPMLLISLPLVTTFAGAVTASAIMLMPYKRRKER